MAIGCSSTAAPDAVEGNGRAAPETSPGSPDGSSELLPDAADELPAPVEGLNPTPAVDFVWFDGTPGSTADFGGEPTVMNFWQSYCPPCIAEMPEFESVFQSLAGTVSFVGMNVADTRDAANELAAKTGVTYPLADDPDSAVFRSFGGFVMPTTVLLNKQGQVAYVWSGILTGGELRTLIDQHLLTGGG